MIRFRDAATLAYTKLQTHKVRTGFTVGLAGILFGLILAVIFVVQGVFDSVDRFSNVGLNNRTIMAISHYDSTDYDMYSLSMDPTFIKDVEKAHKDGVAKKTAAAAKYKVFYEAKVEDPSPITVDPDTSKKIVSTEGMNTTYASEVMMKRIEARDTFNINEHIAPFKSAKLLPESRVVYPESGLLTYMKNGKEQRFSQNSNQAAEYAGPGNDPMLAVLDSSLTKPFVSSATFDPAKGEIPVIIPYSQAEKLLGLKPVEKNAANQVKLDRLHEVRDRLHEVSASYCYRNESSSQLLAQAVQQADAIKLSKSQPNFQQPSLTYILPSDSSCGAVRIDKDTRSAMEKDEADRQLLYEKAIGRYLGEPEQHKVTVRAVGMSSDMPGEGSLSSVGDLVNGLFGSHLGYGTWSIPSDLLADIPEKYRPATLFAADDTKADGNPRQSAMGFLVEFDDKDEARKLMNESYKFNSGTIATTSVTSFGSSTLVVDEMRNYFNKFIFWSLLIVGTVAAVILGGIIGRTISEGRRESAVFRAIGAKRSDIAGIYGVYALLLSARVALFAVVLGAFMAFIVEFLYAKDATVAARVTYAATDTTAGFHLFGVGSIYVPIILLIILVVGMLGAIIPIVRNARRNPINDMRDE